MRRPLAAAAIAIVLPLIAACSAGRADTTGGAGRPGQRRAAQGRADRSGCRSVGRIRPDIDTVDDDLDQLQQGLDTLCAG